MKKIFTFMAVALIAIVAVVKAQDVSNPEGAQPVTLDFTTNTWGLPAKADAGHAAQTYTDGTHTITLFAPDGSTGYYANSGYLMLGKTNASLTLPAFDFDVEKIEVVGTSGASTAVKQNVFVGDVAVSTETTGAKDVTNVYAIAEDYQAAGNIYTKVTSNQNTQISKIIVYPKGAGEITPPEPEVTEVATVAELKALAKDEVFKFTGELVVVSNPLAKYLYVKDETGSTLIYDKDGSGYAMLTGWHVDGGWSGKVAIFNGLFEAVPTTDLVFSNTETPDEVEIDVVDASAITAENMNKVVRLEGVTYTELSGKNFTITVGEAEVAGYNQFGLDIAAPEEGKKYDMIGAISVYNTNVQFQPIAITEVEDEPVVADPLYTVEATCSPLTFEEDGEEITLPAFVEGNVMIDVYDGYAIINDALGIKGAQLKVSYSEYDEQMEYNHVTALELVKGPGILELDEEDGTYFYEDPETEAALVVSPQWAVINQEKGNITMLVVDAATEDYYSYLLVWGAEGDDPVVDEPLMTLNGKVLAEPNAYVSEKLGLEEGENIISMSDPADNVKVDVYKDYFIIRNFMNAEGVDLQCWYQTDEEEGQTLIYKSQIIGQEFAEEDIPGNVQGSYIVVNMEGYDLSMGMCNLNPMGGWLTIVANKLSDMDNFYHYSLDFSPAVEVEKPVVTPEEGEYDELQSFTIKFDQAVTIPVEDYETIWWVPQPYLTGENTYYYESAALIPGENEGEVVFTLEKPIIKADTYTLTLPEGCVEYADGTKNPEFTYTYTVTGNNFTVTTEEGEINMTITPADGSTVGTLSKFELVLEGFVNIPTWEVEAALYDEAGEEVTQGSFEDNQDGTYSIELWNKVTKAGTYTLKFTIPNQNELNEVLATHDYELTYIVDGSDYVEMPYTVWGLTAELPAEENYDNMESAVKLDLATEVVVDEDNFVIKNLFGIEGYDLTAYYQTWGDMAFVSSISLPGIEEPSNMIEVTPNEEIGTVGLMVSNVNLDPKDGSIYLQVVRVDEEENWNYSYYYIVWNPEIATGINHATVIPVSVDGAYNLAGQKVSSNFKGIVIKNGKKVMVK